MTKLKTLKDMELYLWENSDGCCCSSILKAEAIKWVKKHLIFNPETKLWTLTGHMGTEEWMQFFNLTEIDLQETSLEDLK